MKTYKLAIAVLLIAGLALGINACKQKGDNPLIGEEGEYYDAPEFMVPEADNSPAEVQDATLENSLQLPPQNLDYRFSDSEMLKDSEFQRRRHFMPLARILRQLQLDSTQRESVKDFIFNHRLCVREVIMKLRASERRILEPFNERRKAVIEAYRNGEIDRREAARQLRDISMKARKALRENPARVKACEEMKRCRKVLFDNIGSILNEEQKAKWDKWVEHLPDRPCGGR